MNGKTGKILPVLILLALSSCAKPHEDLVEELGDRNERGSISIDLDAGISWEEIVDRANPGKLDVKASKIASGNDQVQLIFSKFYPKDPSGIGDVQGYVGIPEAKCLFDHEQILSFFRGRNFYADSKPHEAIEDQEDPYLFWIDTEEDDLFIGTERIFSGGTMYWSSTSMDDIFEKNIKCNNQVARRNHRWFSTKWRP